MGNTNCDQASTLTFGFDLASSGFTSTERGWIDVAFRRWEQVRGTNGAPYLDVARDDAPFSAGTVEVLEADLDGFNAAVIGCSGDGTPDRVEFDPDAMGNDIDRYQIIASHEAGHTFGLSHTGRDDNTQSSLTGPSYPEPFMATLLTIADRENDNRFEVRVDDDAQVTHLVSSPRWLTANPGFERLSSGQPAHWIRNNSVRETALPANGSSYMKLNPQGTIEQSVHVQWPQAATRTIQVEARYKFGSAGSGGVQFKLWSRARNYSVGAPGTYSGGLDFNNPLGWANGGMERLEVDSTTATFPTQWTPTPQNAAWNDPLDFNRHMHSLKVVVWNQSNTAAFVDDVVLRWV